MSGNQDRTPQPSEKDRLHAHYNQEQHQQQVDQGRDAPPTPTSISLGSPISPLRAAGGASNAILSDPSHASINGEHFPPTLPPYSSPATSSSHLLTPTQQPSLLSPSGPPQKYPGLPPLNYHLYSPPLFELSSDCTTIKSTAPYLSTTATALIALVRAQSTVPPKPQVHITGRRGGPHHRPDFALKLNLMPLLIPDDPAQRMDYLRCVGPNEPALRGGTKASLEPTLLDDSDGGGGGLEAWARRFVADTAPVKAFVLERVVVHLDTAWLEGQLRSLVASMGYKGDVSVTFPVTHARVVVHSPDRVNKFFTGLTTLFSGRRTYEVVKAVWPFASCGRDDGAAGQRRCAVQSEEQWWKEWAQPIRFAIASRRNGWVTSEDKLEAIMEGKGGKGLARVDWGEGDGSW